MDKTWVHLSRLSTEYRDGARKFVNMAQICSGNDDYIICPCTNCRNLHHEHVDIVYEHLIIIGMSPTYTTWVFHGESPSMDEHHDEHVHDEHVDMLDTYRMFRDMYDYGDNDGGTSQNRKEEDFTQKLEDAESPLYPGCTKYTRLSAIVVLFNHKTANGLSDKSFSELLQILRDLLPENNNLPDSMYSTKKLLKTFDLGYEKIDACENDCCLFRGEKEHLDKCPTCQYSRWKINPRTNKIKKGVPVKVLRYFPIIPRFRRMFKSPVKAEQLTWHFSHHSQDGKMRHPVDSPAWYTIDGQWSEFASDARNLRLGLAADGFNPFRNLSTTHSCWPVILVTYNLPPWLCMLKENLMLTLLIPGPKQPGNDIDVYLEPLIEDLKVLWNDGVNIYDANSKSMFNLKAILMWTINDFPAYGNLAGCTTKGKVACPICGVHTCSEWLTHSKKYAYMGHRRFLESNHTFQKKKNWFDGKEQTGKKPQQLKYAYFEMHITELKVLDQRLNHPRNKSLLQKRHKETFCAWLSDKIKVQDSGISERLKWLAYGPRSDVMSYSDYIINGLRFRTKESEKSTQTSGVSIEAETTCRSSAKDTNQIVQKISYYGIIRDIVLLDYHTFRVPLFKCDWASIANGIRIEDGFTLVTLREGQNHFENDPFILASQAKQVFYARDNDTSSCYVVLKAPPRQYNDMELYIESDNTLYTSVDSSIFHLPTNVNENGQHVREGCEGILL